MSYRYILAFGSNSGDRTKNCFQGESLLEANIDIVYRSKRLITKPLTSDVYSSGDHEPYLNYIVEGRSALSPLPLYRKIVGVEDRIGHDRTRRWAPRCLDIDIILAARDDAEKFQNCTPHRMSNSTLSIPHPGLPYRPFLRDLLAVYPGLVEAYSDLL